MFPSHNMCIHATDRHKHGKHSMLRFRKGQLDVLCGSKMVIEGRRAKLRCGTLKACAPAGLDLPGVGMIIVVDANSPGFLRTVRLPIWGLHRCAIFHVASVQQAPELESQ